MPPSFDKIDVLDHGFVRLVDHMGSDLSVVRAARVSHDAAWRVGAEKDDERLINYLWKNKHTSPFEHVTFTFEVKAPIFVFRQWHRHRTWSFNEVSARYTELPNEYYIPAMDQMLGQSTSNKQGRAEPIKRVEEAIDVIKLSCERSYEAYKALLADGLTRELARSVLPVATYSHMFATVNLLNLFRFLALRWDDHSQYEIRVYAEAMYKLVEPIVPVAAQAFLGHGGKV